MRSSPGCSKSICIPFPSEAQYQAWITKPAEFRVYLEQMVKQSPELFPQAMSGGFRFHSLVTSRKQQLQLRRIELKTTGAVYQIRPSFVMPYMIGKTDEVEKALYFCQWGVPFEALAYGFGRDAHYWYRAALSLGRPSLVGTTVKEADRLPRDLVADEKHSWRLGERIYLPTTVADGFSWGSEWLNPPAPQP